MRSRCRPNHAQRANYFDKGITIDPAWDDFDQFVRDMGPRPEGTTLDRENNALGYSKSNCRWATIEEQENNKTTTIRITFNGETLSVAQWARRVGISVPAMWRRLFKFNWPVDRALTQGKQ
jgi:hypothetical protein